MNKKELIRKRTWKYFWQQKFKEVRIFLLIAIPSLVLCYIVGHFVGESILGEFPVHHWLFDTFCGFLIIALFSVVLIFIIYICYSLFGSWIESNWRKASKRANEDFKKKTRRASETAIRKKNYRTKTKRWRI